MPTSAPSFCNVLKGGIEDLKKAVERDMEDIRKQKELIAALIAEHAKPELIDAAKARLAELESTLESDRAQLNAFQEEFLADCT